jgi:hypothetical protein
MARLAEQVRALRARLAKNSHNSSKPSASDGRGAQDAEPADVQRQEAGLATR